MLWNGENPNTFAKIVYINKGGDAPVRVRRHAQDGAQDIQAGPDVRRRRRARSTCACGRTAPARYIAECSTDGEDVAADRRADRQPRQPGRPEDRAQGVRRRRLDERGAVPLLPRRLLGPRRADVDGDGRPRQQPDGELGWYAQPPTVTLDGRRRPARRHRQDRVPDRRRPDADVRRPVPGHRAGRPRRGVLRHRRRAEPNTEPAKTLGVRVDAEAPETGASLARPGGADGPVPVTLDPQDGGGGSGAVLTQYRIGRRAVEDLLGRGRADLRRHGRVARAVGAGRAAAGSSCSATARAGSRRSRAWG